METCQPSCYYFPMENRWRCLNIPAHVFLPANSLLLFHGECLLLQVMLTLPAFSVYTLFPHTFI